MSDVYAIEAVFFFYMALFYLLRLGLLFVVYFGQNRVFVIKGEVMVITLFAASYLATFITYGIWYG